MSISCVFEVACVPHGDVCIRTMCWFNGHLEEYTQTDRSQRVGSGGSAMGEEESMRRFTLVHDENSLLDQLLSGLSGGDLSFQYWVGNRG